MNISEAIANKINAETKPDMTQEQIAYVSGLADALEIVRRFETTKLVVGRIYYIVMKADEWHPENYVKPMRLYRINNKTIPSYCFASNLEPSRVNDASLILHSMKNVIKRVFVTQEEAEKLKDLAFI